MPTEPRQAPWVSSVPIVVSNREAATEWYTKKLGFDVIHNEGHWVSVGRKGTGAELHLCTASENRPAPIPMEPGVSGIVIIVAGDFRAECQGMMDRGVEFSQVPTEAPWGWYATVRDPDGNEHHLSAAPPKA
jgi:lactoylglutathione lyase